MRHSPFFFYCYFVALLIVSIVLSMTACAQKEAGSPPVQFTKHIVSSRFVSEGVATGDVNEDGKIDILAGNYWFEVKNPVNETPTCRDKGYLIIYVVRSGRLWLSGLPY